MKNNTLRTISIASVIITISCFIAIFIIGPLNILFYISASCGVIGGLTTSNKLTHVKLKKRGCHDPLNTLNTGIAGTGDLLNPANPISPHYRNIYRKR